MSDESIRKKRDRRVSSNDEPTTSKNEKRTSLQIGNFLKKNHPELFEISPLPGGYRSHSSARRNAHHNAEESNTSETKILPPTTTKLRTKDRANIGEVLQTTIRCPSASRPLSRDDQKDNSVRICSIAISTVMMLAQRTYDDITMEHIEHTQEYFRGLRQPDGYPENVGQLMQLLTNLTKKQQIVPSAPEEANYEEENEETEHYQPEMSD